MICAHDTFTYLKSTNFFYNLFSCFWRCQKKNIEELYSLGVRCFDIRVVHKKDYWICAHGKAKLKIKFNTLEDIISYIDELYPGSIIRIILESGGHNEKITTKFKEECDFILDKYKDMIWQLAIKSPWTYLYISDKNYDMFDYTCHLFNWNLDRSFIENIKQFDFSSISIKKWAKKHNIELTKEIIEDPHSIHVIDYIGIYPKK